MHATRPTIGGRGDETVAVLPRDDSRIAHRSLFQKEMALLWKSTAPCSEGDSHLMRIRIQAIHHRLRGVGSTGDLPGSLGTRCPGPVTHSRAVRLAALEPSFEYTKSRVRERAPGATAP